MILILRLICGKWTNSILFSRGNIDICHIYVSFCHKYVTLFFILNNIVITVSSLHRSENPVETGKSILDYIYILLSLSLILGWGITQSNIEQLVTFLLLFKKVLKTFQRFFVKFIRTSTASSMSVIIFELYKVFTLYNTPLN